MPEAVPADRAPQSRSRLDPRTKVALLLLVSLTIMSPGGGVFIPAAAAIGLALAVHERAWRRLAILPAIGATCAALVYLLPSLVEHPAVTIVAVASTYALRLVAVAGIAMHLVATTSPGELTAALRWARMPRAITVATAVMLRFIPIVISEGSAVRDAMRLRGFGGWSDLARHPVTAAERFTVPLMASTLRGGEDLAAAAMLRGLGSRVRPTTARPLRFATRDGVCVLGSMLVVALTLGWTAVAT